MAIFGGRPIGAAVEAPLTIIVNRQSSSSPIGFVFVAAAVSVVITQEREKRKAQRNLKTMRALATT